MPNWNDQALGGGTYGATPHPFFVNGHPISSLTVGADQVPVAGTVYFGAVYVPHRKFVTSIGYLIGTVGTGDKVIGAIYNAAGQLLASSALAGITMGNASVIQELPITLTGGAVSTGVELEGPGYYYVSISCNGTTARLRVSVSGGGRAGSAAGSFGTLAAITPPTASAASIIAYLV
jgi:hypothetical protein